MFIKEIGSSNDMNVIYIGGGFGAFALILSKIRVPVIFIIL